jgi:hypothetical protein
VIDVTPEDLIRERAPARVGSKLEPTVDPAGAGHFQHAVRSSAGDFA